MLKYKAWDADYQNFDQGKTIWTTTARSAAFQFCEMTDTAAVGDTIGVYDFDERSTSYWEVQRDGVLEEVEVV